MYKTLIVVMLATLAMGCSRGSTETADTHELRDKHVRQMEELDAKRQATLAKLGSMDLPALVSLLEEDAQKMVEPFNSPAYREITKQRRDQHEALLEQIKERKVVSYLPLLALRAIDPRGYASLDGSLKVEALLGAFGRSESYNMWGLPHLYWEDAAKAMMELGEVAVPGLTSYLQDRSPAPVWGSEETAEYEAYQYRRCDYALAMLMEMRGENVKALPQDPKKRDALISGWK